LKRTKRLGNRIHLLRRTQSSRGHVPHTNESETYHFALCCYYVNIIILLPRVFAASFSIREWNMTDRRNNDMMSIVNSSIHIIIFFNSHFDSEFKRNIFYTCWRSIFLVLLRLAYCCITLFFYTACVSNITITLWTKSCFYLYRYRNKYNLHGRKPGTPFII